MNQELIKELAKQAGYLPDTFGIGHWDMPECRKFAELIVRECVLACTNEGKTWEVESAGEYTSNVYANAIKKHFGIEERKGWVCPKCGIDRTKDVCPKGHTAAITGDCPMTATAQSGRELIGYTEREEGYYPMYAPPKGSIVTQAFILCKYCNGAISPNSGPRSDAVCIPCYEKDPDEYRR